MVVDEGFLQSDKPVVANRSLLRIYVDDAEFADTRVIEVECGCHTKLEIRRFEGGVALN